MNYFDSLPENVKNELNDGGVPTTILEWNIGHLESKMQFMALFELGANPNEVDMAGNEVWYDLVTNGPVEKIKTFIDAASEYGLNGHGSYNSMYAMLTEVYNYEELKEIPFEKITDFLGKSKTGEYFSAHAIKNNHPELLERWMAAGGSPHNCKDYVSDSSSSSYNTFQLAMTRSQWGIFDQLAGHIKDGTLKNYVDDKKCLAAISENPDLISADIHALINRGFSLKVDHSFDFGYECAIYQNNHALILALLAVVHENASASMHEKNPAEGSVMNSLLSLTPFQAALFFDPNTDPCAKDNIQSLVDAWVETLGINGAMKQCTQEIQAAEARRLTVMGRHIENNATLVNSMLAKSCANDLLLEILDTPKP